MPNEQKQQSGIITMSPGQTGDTQVSLIGIEPEKNEQKHSEELVCEKCGGQYSLKDECDPSEFCDDCVHDVVDELRAQNAQLQKDLEELKMQLEEAEYTTVIVWERNDAASTLDLMADEFRRIQALTDNTEIDELCQRAISGIKQTVPVITQRDNYYRELQDVRQQKEHWENLATGIAAECSEAKTRVKELEKQLKDSSEESASRGDHG